MSESSAAKKESAKESGHGLDYAPLHGGLGGGGGGHHGSEDGGEGNWLVSYADMMTLLVGFFVILVSFSTLDPEKYDAVRKSVTQEFGGQFQIPYSELADRLREIAKKLGVGDQFFIKESDIGIEISSRGTVFFDTGSADMKDEAKPVLRNMIDVIKAEAAGFHVTIEGHTDDVPLIGGRQFRNNFELSSIRACRVLEVFMNAEFPQTDLTAVGYGESRPLVPNRDANGEALVDNQAQNRRVVIKIFKAAQPLLKAGEAEKIATAGTSDARTTADIKPAAPIAASATAEAPPENSVDPGVAEATFQPPATAPGPAPASVEAPPAAVTH